MEPNFVRWINKTGDEGLREKKVVPKVTGRGKCGAVSFREILRPLSSLIILQNLALFSHLDRTAEHGEYCLFNYRHLKVTILSTVTGSSIAPCSGTAKSGFSGLKPKLRNIQLLWLIDRYMDLYYMDIVAIWIVC